MKRAVLTPAKRNAGVPPAVVGRLAQRRNGVLDRHRGRDARSPLCFEDKHGGQHGKGKRRRLEDVQPRSQISRARSVPGLLSAIAPLHVEEKEVSLLNAETKKNLRHVVCSSMIIMRR